MRVIVGVLGLILLTAAASAADLKVKVVDPQSAAVAGAQVSLLRGNDSKVLDTQNTSAEGLAIFHVPSEGAYRIQVLGPGFAAETVGVSSQAEITVNLRLAIAAETVVVSATRTPVLGEAAGARHGHAQRLAVDSHAAGSGERRHAISSGCSGQHGGTARWVGIFVRARRRIELQQGNRRRRDD